MYFYHGESKLLDQDIFEGGVDFIISQSGEFLRDY